MSKVDNSVEAGAGAGAVRPVGYAAVAAWMAADADGESLICRRFTELGSRNLLYLQAELFEIKANLAALDASYAGTWDISSEKMNLKHASMKWEALQKHAATDADCKRYLALIKELREKIKEYYEAIQLMQTMAHIRRPRTSVWSAFTRFFMGPKGNKPIIWGKASQLLDDYQDVFALRMPESRDPLTTCLHDHWIFSKMRDDLDANDHTRYVASTSISRVVATISALSASVLLIAAIMALHFATSDNVKMALLAVFTLMFALCMGTMTNARRGELFGATAAYAAVLVVFVSGNLGS